MTLEEQNAAAIRENQPTVHIIALLDMSGSMGMIQKEVIGSFNDFIQQQQKNDAKAIVSVVCFDNRVEHPYTKVPLAEMPAITARDYHPRGLTALYDSVGQGIANNQDDEHVILLIQTDGQDNASKMYSQTQVKEMIQGKTAAGWDINFMGADINVDREARKMGIHPGKAAMFAKNKQGVATSYDAMSASTTSYINKVSQG